MRKLALLPVFALVSLGLTGQADAGTYYSSVATFTVRDGWVGTADCYSGYDFSKTSYQLVVDESAIADLDYWEAEVTVAGPGFSDTLYGVRENWETLYLCDEFTGNDGTPGLYTADALLTVHHGDGSETQETLSTTFNVVGPARSTVSYRMLKFGEHDWKIPVVVKRGAAPWRRKEVVLQGKECGVTWVKIATLTTNRYGRVVFATKLPADWNQRRDCGTLLRKTPFRLHIKKAERVWGSNSSTFRIIRR